MLLSDVKSVLELLGGSTSNENQSAVTPALAAVTTSIENRIGSSFRRNTVVDFFDINIVTLHEAPAFIKLRLSRGFLDETLPVSIRVSTDNSMLADETSGEARTEHFFVDHEKGIITVYGQFPAHARSISVHYTSGYATSGTLYKNVPEWVEQGAKALASQRVMTENINFVRSKHNNYDPSHHASAISEILNERTRPRQGVFYPSEERVLS
jgi:hypothetical protein